MIGSSENRISYNGNGIATEFAYTFKILEKSNLKVLHVAADGTEELLTTDYYVDMEKSVVLYPGYAPGAEIPEQNRPPILPVGERLVLYREVPITQESALDKHWPFNVIENGLDKLTIICQQIWDRLQRSFYVSESTSSNFDPKVPIEAGKTFRVKDDGTGFEVTEDPGKVIDGATALLERTTEQANIAVESSTNAQNAATSVKKYKALWFDSVAAMKAEPSLTAGAYVNTAGYYTTNDGGGASYLIRAKADSDTIDNGSLHELSNGLVAELLVENGTVCPEQFGAKGDGITDDTNFIQNAINYSVFNKLSIYGNGKTYLVSDAVKAVTSVRNDEYGLYITDSLIMENFKFYLKDGVGALTSVLNVYNDNVDSTVMLRNIEVNGNRQNQNTTVSSQDGGLHGLRIGQVDVPYGKVILDNVYVHDCYTDGILTRPSTTDGVIISNSKITYNGRTGIDPESYNCRIENCLIEYNGQRTAPRCGIQREADHSFDYGTLEIIRCTIRNHEEGDVKFHQNKYTYNTKNIIVDNCEMDTFFWANFCVNECHVDHLSFDNCTITRILISKDNDNILADFRNVYVNNCIIGSFSLEGFTNETFDTNLTIKNSTIKSSCYLYRNFNNVTIENCNISNDIFASGDADVDVGIFLNYQRSTAEDIIHSMILANNIFNGKSRAIQTYSMNIKNINISNNMFNTNSIPMNLGQISRLYILGNTLRRKNSGEYIFMVNSCDYAIVKNNITNYSITAHNIPSTATKIIEDNISNANLDDLDY